MLDIKISPSILSADFGKLNEDIQTIEEYVDYIHVDVMDGHFVPNISFGIPVMKCINTSKPLDVHLMISEPEKYIEDFAKAGASIITVHAEVCNNLSEIISKIKKLGVRAAVSINPDTEVSAIEDVLDEVDMVLVMSVHPGFGGQSFIESVLPKIKKIREMKANLDIEIDGGINAETVKLAKEAGANIIVAGSYIFKSIDRKEAIASLR